MEQINASRTVQVCYESFQIIYGFCTETLNNCRLNLTFLTFIHVQQLKATIRELDKLKEQLIESDVGAFQRRIEPTKVEASNAIQEFSKLHNIITKQIQESMNQEPQGVF